MTKDEWYRQLFERLDNSKFRSSFHLKQKDIDYINEKGLDTIRQHAADFIAKREAGHSKEKNLVKETPGINEKVVRSHIQHEILLE